MNYEKLLDEAFRSAIFLIWRGYCYRVSCQIRRRKNVMKLSPEELGKILSMTIEAINKGAVETIDVLVRDQISLV